VAAAYLSHNPDGTWSAAVHGDLSAYSVVAATPEPAGGSPTPTAAKVIEGSLTGS
jgi:anti-sigma-K factor RskA